MEILEPTVLIVDDERPTRKALVRALSDVATIREAESAEDALRVLDAVRVDVVVSDHDMPGMSGLDLLRTVRLRWPLVQRLICTASHEFGLAVRAINLGEVARFVTKPWEDDELRCSVSQAIEQAALEREVRHLREQVRRTKSALDELERLHPGITKLQRDATGAILLDGTDEIANP